MASPCMHDSVWLQQHKYEDAEAFYQKVQAGTLSIKGAPATDMPKVPANVNDAQAESSRSNDHKKTETSSIKNEIAQARQHIQNVLRSGGSGGAASVAAAGAGGDATKRIENLEKENQDLRKAVDDMKALVSKLEGRVGCLESCSGSGSAAASAPAKPPAQVTPPAAAAADDDDDDFDMFGSDDEDTKAEQEKLKEERLKAYHEKKAKKPTVVAKSSVILDVKPYDDETDMLEVEKKVRSIKIDGLLWAASKLVPMAYGIRKLQIGIVIEDDKISVDDLIDKITEDYEEEVQSVDIAAFNKL